MSFAADSGGADLHLIGFTSQTNPFASRAPEAQKLAVVGGGQAGRSRISPDIFLPARQCACGSSPGGKPCPHSARGTWEPVVEISLPGTA